MQEIRNEYYNILVGKHGKRRPFRRTRRRWEDTTEMNLRKVCGRCVEGDVGWIQVAHDKVLWWALVITVIKLRLP
jgi:hypothetical protein